MKKTNIMMKNKHNDGETVMSLGEWYTYGGFKLKFGVT